MHGSSIDKNGYLLASKVVQLEVTITSKYYNIDIVWQVLGLIHQLVQENKAVTQREGYYCLVQHFKNQAEFNDTLQGISVMH